IDADSARAQVDAERAARQRAEADAAAARERAARAEAEAQTARVIPPPPVATQGPDPAARQKTELRMRLLEQMNGVMPTRDTPRGLMATVSESSFNGATLRETVALQIARLA